MIEVYYIPSQLMFVGLPDPNRHPWANEWLHVHETLAGWWWTSKKCAFAHTCHLCAYRANRLDSPVNQVFL